MWEKLKFYVGLLVGIVLMSACCLLAGHIKFSFTNGQPLQKSFQADEKLGYLDSMIDKFYIDQNTVSDKRTEFLDELYFDYVASLNDPYSSYMDSTYYAQFQQESTGSYAGIGVVVSTDKDDQSITVVTVFDDTPGSHAGIKPGDKILKVNGQDVNTMIDTAVSMIKGEPGTTVDVTFFRGQTDETLTFTLTREKINIPTVSHKIIDGHIGYIEIAQFDEITYEQFASAYRDITRQNAKSLIIDLRNNPGGLLDTVTKITDMLLPEGIITYTIDKDGKRNDWRSNAACTDLPMVILVNDYSASASEVMTGALKDYKMATVIGTTTFGKGIVQRIFPIGDGSAVKLTVSKYYSPNGVCIHGTGIEPDIMVEMSHEDIGGGNDIQLQKAVEVLNSF